MKIKVSYNTFKVITDKPLDGSTSLSPEETTAFLESTIPHTASRCPISTSRGWEHHKKEKTASDYETVIITWLPALLIAGIALISWLGLCVVLGIPMLIESVVQTARGSSRRTN